MPYAAEPSRLHTAPLRGSRTPSGEAGGRDASAWSGVERWLLAHGQSGLGVGTAWRAVLVAQRATEAEQCQVDEDEQVPAERLLEEPEELDDEQLCEQRDLEEGLRNLLAALRQQGQSPRRIIFLSSTAVYGQTRGEWVDESSATEPDHFSGRRLLEAEALLRESGVPAIVLRLGGIYGPRRTRLIDEVRQGRAATSRNGPRYTNRIHRDDCVGALDHLIELAEPADCYLGVDCEPADWLRFTVSEP